MGNVKSTDQFSDKYKGVFSVSAVRVLHVSFGFQIVLEVNSYFNVHL